MKRVRPAVLVAGTVLGLYALTVVAVWGVALLVDWRGDVSTNALPSHPKEPS
ncbi:MAG: hypothetical protein ACLGHM_09725 [Actinomycetes bacterium]